MTLISVGTITEVSAFSISVLQLSECEYGTVEHAAIVSCFALNVVSQGRYTYEIASTRPQVQPRFQVSISPVCLGAWPHMVAPSTPFGET